MLDSTIDEMNSPSSGLKPSLGGECLDELPQKKQKTEKQKI